jgi:TPR repeat protein
MYENGLGGLAQSDTEAVRWYRQPAKHGNANGQN